MTTRLPLFFALAVLTAAGAADPPPPAPAKTVRAVPVSVLNQMFQKDASGATAKRLAGRPFTVSGTVRAVDEGPDGVTLSLMGPPGTPADLPGCTVSFPKAHPSFKVAKGLQLGAAVTVRGDLGDVAAGAFTLTKPVLVPAAGGAAPAKDPVAVAKAPAATPKPVPSIPKSIPKPVPPPVAELKPEDLKTTAVALTEKLRDDKTEKLWLSYLGKDLEIAGEVESVEHSKSTDTWYLDLTGCPVGDAGEVFRVSIDFPPGSPDVPRVRNLSLRDPVTVRGESGIASGRTLQLKNAQLVAGGEKAPRPQAPVRTATAEAFVQELLSDRAAAEKYRGQRVTLTGEVSGAGPPYTTRGLDLNAGKLKPTDRYGVFAECSVVDEQREAVWQLVPKLKVRVTGVVGRTLEHKVPLIDCRVVLLEPNLTPTVPVTELSAAYRTDPKAAAAKYGSRFAEQWMYLTGEVAALTPNQYGVLLTLKGPDGPKVETTVPREDAAKLKVGDPARLCVRCYGLTDDKARVVIGGILLAEAKTPLVVEK